MPRWTEPVVFAEGCHQNRCWILRRQNEIDRDGPANCVATGMDLTAPTTACTLSGERSPWSSRSRSLVAGCYLGAEESWTHRQQYLRYKNGKSRGDRETGARRDESGDDLRLSCRRRVTVVFVVVVAGVDVVAVVAVTAGRKWLPGGGWRGKEEKKRARSRRGRGGSQQQRGRSGGTAGKKVVQRRGETVVEQRKQSSNRHRRQASCPRQRRPAELRSARQARAGWQVPPRQRSDGMSMRCSAARAARNTPQGEAKGRARCRRLVKFGYQAGMTLAPGLTGIFEASSPAPKHSNRPPTPDVVLVVD